MRTSALWVVLLGAPEVAAVVKRAGELGLAVLFDGFSPFDSNQPGKFLRLSVENPKTRMIIARDQGSDQRANAPSSRP